MIHVYAITTATTVFVATSGYLLFLKHQKVGDSKRTRKTKVATAFIAVLLFSTLIGVQLVNLTRANPYVYVGEVPPKPDTIPPMISIFYPKNNTAFNVNYFALTFNVSAPTGPTVNSPIVMAIYYKADWQQNNVSVYKYTSDPYSGRATNGRYTEYSSNLNLTGIPEGNHSIIVSASYHGWYIPGNDPHTLSMNGFSIGGSSSVNFTIDTISPNVSVLSVDNKTYGTSGVPLNFTVSEQTAWIGYSLDGQANVTITGNTTLSGLPEGSHNLVIYAEDTGGNTGDSETFYFAVDNTPPSISLLTTENKTYSTSDIQLNFTVTEPTAWIGYSLDGQKNVTIIENTTLSGLSDGSHSLTVYAKDAAGNIGTSKTVHFSIDQTPKLVILGSTLPMEYGYVLAAVIMVIIVAMAGYLFVKRKKLGEGT